MSGECFDQTGFLSIDTPLGSSTLASRGAGEDYYQSDRFRLRRRSERSLVIDGTMVLAHNIPEAVLVVFGAAFFATLWTIGSIVPATGAVRIALAVANLLAARDNIAPAFPSEMGRTAMIAVASVFVQICGTFIMIGVLGSIAQQLGHRPANDGNVPLAIVAYVLVLPVAIGIGAILHHLLFQLPLRHATSASALGMALISVFVGLVYWFLVSLF
jgi:hypothetical protein